eukprot:238567_1
MSLLFSAFLFLTSAHSNTLTSIQNIPSCGITYDDYLVDEWSRSATQASVSSPSQIYRGFWSGKDVTRLNKLYTTTTSSQMTFYFTFVWGCEPNAVTDSYADEASIKYSIWKANGDVMQYRVSLSLGETPFLTYGYNDPLLWTDPYCSERFSSDTDIETWREYGAILDGFVTFDVDATETFEIRFTGLLTSDVDEFWGVTNIAWMDHSCDASVSIVTANSIWNDDLFYDDTYGWSLPHLVLWDQANNGNKYHGWFNTQSMNLNRTFACDADASITITFDFIFAGNWETENTVKVYFVDDSQQIMHMQQFQFNANDPLVTDAFVITYIDYTETGHYTAYKHAVSMSNIAVDAYQDFTVVIDTQFTNREGYEAFWGIGDFQINAFPTLKPTARPITSAAQATVTFQLSAHHINLYVMIPSNSILRSKLQAVVYEYFSDYKYSITISMNSYHSVTSQTEIHFQVKKGGFEAWTNDELDLIEQSVSSPILYKQIAIALELQWTGDKIHFLQCIQTTYCDANDLYTFLASGDADQIQNVKDNLMNIDFADVTQATSNNTTPAPTPTTTPVIAPCITQIEYDVPTTLIRIHFDRNTNYGGLTARFECIDLIINMEFIGHSAVCQWASRSVLTIAIGMDNTLIENADHTPQLALKAGVISGYNDAYIQNDMLCLQGDVVFKRMYPRLLDISADIDGNTRATICNTLHYTSAGSLGAYGTKLEYFWSVYWGNNTFVLANVDKTSHDLIISISDDIISEIEQRFGIESIATWPTQIAIQLRVKNWLGMRDTTTFYTWIHNDYSLGVIYIFGPQFGRRIPYNEKNRIRAIASIEICNVSTQHNQSETVYDLLSSQYELQYEWNMMSSTVPDLDENHLLPDAFRTIDGEVLTSTTTTVHIDAYELKPFGKYLFEVKTTLFDTQTVDYVSVRVLPPIIYSTPPIYRILSSMDDIALSVNDIFSVDQLYTTVLLDSYNLTLTNLLQMNYTITWECFAVNFMDQSDAIDDFMLSIQYRLDYVDGYDSCDTFTDLYYDANAVGLQFNHGELEVGYKYLFRATINDPYYETEITNYYALWINPGLIPSIAVHIKESGHSKRGKCNAAQNRIEFKAVIHNYNALKYYYNQGHHHHHHDELKKVEWQWISNQVNLYKAPFYTHDHRLVIYQKKRGKHNKYGRYGACYGLDSEECESKDSASHDHHHHKRRLNTDVEYSGNAYDNWLLDGQQYTFYVIAAFENGLVGAGAIDFITNNAPSGGKCYIKGYASIAWSDTINMSLSAGAIGIELDMICFGWNDLSQDLPLTYNVLTVYSSLVNDCNDYSTQIASPTSTEWDFCRGTFIGEFEQGITRFMLGQGTHVLIAHIRDQLGYDGLYKLPKIVIDSPPLQVQSVHQTTSTTLPQSTSSTTITSIAPTITTATATCNHSLISQIESSLVDIETRLNNLSIALTRIGDTQIYFQALTAMNALVDSYLALHVDCLSNATQIWIMNIKLNIISLTDVIMQHSTTTITAHNLQNQINVISHVLDLFCAGAEGYDDSDHAPSKSEMLSTSSSVWRILSQHFTEHESQPLFDIVRNIIVQVLALDEFENDALSEQFSDPLMDIISSIHVWFALNLAANSKYGNMKQITDLIHLIANASLTNTSIVNEKRYWSSCWMDIDLSFIDLSSNMSQCNGFASNIEWPQNFSNTFLDDSYQDMSTVSCLVSEYLYNNELVLNIELMDDQGTAVHVNNSNDTQSCAAIEFTICNTESIYTLFDETSDSILADYNVPFCEYVVLDSLNAHHTDEWDTNGCHVSEYTESCVTCACSHLTLFKADASEYTPKPNVIAVSSYQELSLSHFKEYPAPALFVLTSAIFFAILFLCTNCPCIFKQDSKPLIACSDTVIKSVKDEMISSSGYALSLIEIDRDDINFCHKVFNVFVLYMKDYHTILSIFTSTSHTNYNSKQRILCCYMYLMTICMCCALFYGQKKESFFGPVILMTWSSLFTCVPVYCIIYLFQFSRPSERSSQLKHAILSTNLFLDSVHQLSAKEVETLDLETCAKWLIDYLNNCHEPQLHVMKTLTETNVTELELAPSLDSVCALSLDANARLDSFDFDQAPFGVPLNNRQRMNENPILPRARQRDEQMIAQISCDIRERMLINAQDIIRTERIRKQLIKSEYPLPHYCKKVAWCLLIVWCIICCAAILFYGAHFDLTYKVCSTTQETYDVHSCAGKSDETLSRRLLTNDTMCYWKQGLNERVLEQIVDYINGLFESGEIEITGLMHVDTELLETLGITNLIAEQTDVYHNRMDIWGTNITDSNKWILTCLNAIVIGFVGWQTLWLFFIAIVYVCLPSKSVFSCTQRSCPCCFSYFEQRDAVKEARDDLMMRSMDDKENEEEKCSALNEENALIMNGLIEPNVPQRRQHLAVREESISDQEEDEKWNVLVGSYSYKQFIVGDAHLVIDGSEFMTDLEKI